MRKRRGKNRQRDREKVAGVVSVANAVPKRMLQLAGVAGEALRVELVCWKRFERGNVPDAVLVEACSFKQYAIKLIKLLCAKRYDLILFDELRLLPIMIVMGKLTGARIVYNRQEIPTLAVAEKLFSICGVPVKQGKRFADCIEISMMKRVHGALSIPLVDAEVAKLKKSGIPVSVVWNLPERSGFLPLSERRPVDGDCERYFIYAGEVAWEYGLRSILKLVRYLNMDGYGVKLLLVGRLWKLSGEELFSEINAASCNEWVEYREWVPYEEALKLMRGACGALALTDPYYEKFSYMGEGASRKVFTYMSAGIPVIAGGAFGKIVEEENAGYFVNYHDFGELLESARDLLSNEGTARKMGDAGRRAIVEKYNWENEQDKVKKLLSEVMTA